MKKEKKKREHLQGMNVRPSHPSTHPSIQNSVEKKKKKNDGFLYSKKQQREIGISHVKEEEETQMKSESSIKVKITFIHP